MRITFKRWVIGTNIHNQLSTFIFFIMNEDLQFLKTIITK